MAVVSLFPPGRGLEKGELLLRAGDKGQGAWWDSPPGTRIVTSWKESDYPAEALPFGFNFIARAVGVGEGGILGEEPLKTWGEEAGSSHLDCTTLKYGGIRIPNVFVFFPEINCLHLHVDSQMVVLFIAKHV